MALRVVFFGTPDFAATVLGGLVESPHEVVAAVAAPDRPSGRGRKVVPGAVSALARERGLTLFQPERLDGDAREQLRSFGADVFAVASYGLIFSRAVLAIPPRGAVNAHASLLPQLRGAAPVERAILAGLERTGTSIQRMVREVDAGGVYARREVEIGPRETAGTLRARLARVAAELLPEVLGRIESGDAGTTAQDGSRATHAPPLAPEERAVRWAEPAFMIDRRVRAFAPQPGAFALLPAELGAKRLKILDAAPGPAPAGDAEAGTALLSSDREGLAVRAGEGSVRLLVVQPEGKRPMDAAAFVRGHAVRPGMRFLDGLEAGTRG